MHGIGRNVTAGPQQLSWFHHADHWMFEGTGLGYGDVLGARASASVVGYECDGCVFTYREGCSCPTGEAARRRPSRS